MGGGGVSFLLRSRVPFVCVGYDTVPGQHPHGDWARRKNLSEEDIKTGERERLQVLQHAPGRVSRASPQSNCVYPFVTLRAQLEGLIVITTTATTVSEKQYKQILLLYYIERIHVKWYEPKSHAVLSPSLFPHRLKPKKGPTVVVVVRFWFYFSLTHSSTSLV
jgi:hypothetical protein